MFEDCRIGCYDGKIRCVHSPPPPPPISECLALLHAHLKTVDVLIKLIEDGRRRNDKMKRKIVCIKYKKEPKLSYKN